MFNAAGEIIGCQMNGVVAWNPKTKEERVLADKYDGKALNRPNDLVVDSVGGVYFTDPIFSLNGKSNQPVSGVFYVTDGGLDDHKLTRLIDDVVMPNGIILSPDEKTLYVIPFVARADRGLSGHRAGQARAGARLLHDRATGRQERRGGDSCAVDSRGNLYIAAATGIQVFDPQGKLLGTIKVPKTPSNCDFGGKDMKTLYVTARTSVYAFPMEVVGHRFPGGGTNSIKLSDASRRIPTSGR